jgi:pentatricopeptide repeat protein
LSTNVGIGPHVPIAWAMAKMQELSNRGNLQGVKQVWLKQAVHGRHTNLYNLFIEAHVENGTLDEVLSIIEDMKTEQIPMDFRSYFLVIDCCIRSDDLEQAYRYFEELMKLETLHKTDESIYNLLIHANAKIGTCVAAEELYKDLEHGRGASAGLKPSRLTKVCLLGCYSSHGEFEKALMLFDQLDDIDQFAYRSLFLGLCKYGKLSEAFELQLSMKKKRNLLPDITMAEALCESCLKHGTLRDSLQAYQSTTQPTFQIFKTTHQKCIQENDLALAWQIRNEAESQGFDIISIK